MRKAWESIERLKAKHRAVVWAAQVGVFALSGVAAFVLRFDLSLPRQYLRDLAYALPIWIVVKIAVFRTAKLDRGWWRYVSVPDLVRLAVGNVAGSALSCGAIVCVGPAGFPRSIYLLDLMICFLATAGVRVAARVGAEAIRHGRNGAPAKSTLIYGAGDAGVTLLREIQNNPKLPYRVKGFLDDGPEKKGVRILGVTVLGGGERVRAAVAKYKIDVILVAIPSATGAQMARILEQCHAAGAECKTVPGMGEVIEEGGLADQIRDVAVEDLLGRNPVRLDASQIRGAIEGKVVMVTGAAGSIGSELCRQIAKFRPAGIVGFEIAESPLFEIDREMRGAFPEVPFYPEIGNIQNRARLDEVMGKYSPAAVYHAAAYKHVPLMETHVFEAIENNVFGTYNVAMAAVEHGVENFVMISSDKAVRPSNVMGASKRVAEMVLLGLQSRDSALRSLHSLGESLAEEEEGGDGGPTRLSTSVALLASGQSRQSPSSTKLVAVRFGNVLGSNGSVIPIFKKQIAAGGPVTVTHPEMRRFFMTIPEACQLVLQASAIGESGQICVLDMGEPVKIVDLARNLILLSGRKPEEDIKIAFTGVRPGEKLYEELSSLLEDTVPTAHEKIRIFVGNGMPQEDLEETLDRLRESCETRDVGRLLVALKEIVLDYSPSAELLRRVIKVRDRRTEVAVG
jgi:FlaA1/EpsC-like NDP-sugar epimerase